MEGRYGTRRRRGLLSSVGNHSGHAFRGRVVSGPVVIIGSKRRNLLGRSPKDPGPVELLACPAPVAIGIFARLPQRLHGGHGALPPWSQSPADHAPDAVAALYGSCHERSSVVARLLRWSLLAVHNQIMLASERFDTHFKEMDSEKRAGAPEGR